jgi:hypothetical protein
MADDMLDKRFVRQVVIRGDIVALGIVMVAGGLMALASPLLGHPGWLSVVGLVSVAGGLGAIRWARKAYGILISAVVERFADHDAGPSPVPWVSDELWRSKNRFDPELDAINELIAEVDEFHPHFDEVKGQAIREPELRPVSDNERDLVTPPAEPTGLPEGPKGSADALVEALTSTPGRSLVIAPRWPVCCQRLTVLVALAEAQRPSDAKFLTQDVSADAWQADPRGQHSFRCGTCGRAYATDPAW